MPQLKLLEIIGVLVALAALVGTVVAAYKMVDSRGYARGTSEERAVWQARESKELADTNALLLMSEAKARKLEGELNGIISKTNRERKQADETENLRRDTAINIVRNGMRDACRTAASESPGAGNAGTTTGTAGGIDGTARGEFFEQVGSFLSAEAIRADQIARRLSQAQELLVAYRATCNAP